MSLTGMSLKEHYASHPRLRGGNHLIDCLPPQQRAAFLALCEPIELAVGTVLSEAGQPYRHAYFPVRGAISLASQCSGHPPFETESIGYQGMLGATLALNINLASQRSVVQTPCIALQVTAKQLQKALRDHPALLQIVQHYLFTVYAALQQTAVCVRFHSVEERLARTLLLAHDRDQTNHLPMTHRLLAGILGVQRGAVTIAAIKLQRDGLIHYRRGKVSILNRRGLEAQACECYRVSSVHYANLHLLTGKTSPYVRYRTDRK